MTKLKYSSQVPSQPTIWIQIHFLDCTRRNLTRGRQQSVKRCVHLFFQNQSNFIQVFFVQVTKKLKEKEIKRQEHIYEFILTEKHHCLTLRVMQKVFVDGLQKYFQLGNVLDRMFPRLHDLTEIHLSFLHKLRERQKSSTPTIDSIADILLEQFSGAEAEKLKSAYGEFCSRHR
jgi:RhoGEF domain